jgi:hypothetical protein
MVLYCVVKMMAKIHKSSNLRSYSYHYDLRKIIGNDFKPSLSCLINKGIVFEGTIGSFYKIDAGYLGEDIYFT